MDKNHKIVVDVALCVAFDQAVITPEREPGRNWAIFCSVYGIDPQSSKWGVRAKEAARQALLEAITRTGYFEECDGK